MSIGQARDRALPLDISNGAIQRPNQLGVQVFDAYDLSLLVDRIDWTPFFHTWEMKGKGYPAILTDERLGEQARSLYEDAQAMLQKIVDEKWLTARAVVGLFPQIDSDRT